MPEVIALFGGTGSTGRHILKLALDQGFKVQVLARTPSKITDTHENLSVIQGSFSDDTAVQETIKGADYVICAAGGKKGDKDFQKDMMKNFVTKLWTFFDEDEKNLPKAFLYQAGSFVPRPDGSNPLFLKFMRATVAWLLGISELITDHENVIKFIAANPKPGMRVIVTRPAGLKVAEGGQKLVASEENYELGMVAFKDLAAFTLEAIKDESLDGKYPFIKIAEK